MLASRTRHISQAFTLIEMIAVIVIIACLAVVTVPAFVKLTKGQGVSLGVRTVNSKLNMCRDYAITKRDRVALLMPRADVGDNCFRCYRACIVDSSNTFVKWIPGENWGILDQGSAIMEADTDAGVTFGSGNQDPQDGTYLQVNNVDLAGAGASAGAKNGVRAVIFKSTGMLASTDNIYVTIGEGAVQGGTFTCTNTSNKLELIVDKFTGRISYNE